MRMTREGEKKKRKEEESEGCESREEEEALRRGEIEAYREKKGKKLVFILSHFCWSRMIKPKYHADREC